MVKIVVPNPYQVVPSAEYANVLIPCPVAINKLLLYVIPLVCMENKVYPNPTQVVPLLLEYNKVSLTVGVFEITVDLTVIKSDGIP